MSDSNQVTKHIIKHSYKPIIYVPYVGISNNIDLFLVDCKKIAKLADGKIYEIVNFKALWLKDCKQEIEDIYHISFDLWLEKWIKTCPELGTKDCFIRIELKEYKEE